MATNDIACAGLTATPSIRGNLLAWSTSGEIGALHNVGLDVVEVWSSITNDRTTASKIAEGQTSAIHVGLIEEVTYYYWIKARDNLGNYGNWYPSGSTSGVAATAIGMSGLAFGLANGKLLASVSANALTVALKTVAGNDPSASDSVYVAFRNATLATGNYTIRQIKVPVSLTLPSGATAGFTANDPSRLWGMMCDVGDGTVKLALSNRSTLTTIYGLSEFGLATTVINDTAADNAGVLYADSVLTNVPFRVAGFVDWNSGLATPGTWVAPGPIQMFGAGIKLPGDYVGGRVINATSAVVTGTVGVPVQFPFDDTPPQITEGDQFLSTSITPTSPVNFIESFYEVFFTNDGEGDIGSGLFRVGNSNCLSFIHDNNGVNYPEIHRRTYLDRANSASAITYTVRASGLGGHGGSTKMNGYNASARFFGGTQISQHTLREIVG